MSNTSRALVVVSLLSLACVTPLAAAQGKPTSSGAVSACSLLSPADIRQITGRTDLATGDPDPEEMPGHSNCIFSGAFDIGITVNATSKAMFLRMRDTYRKAPSRLGYRVEEVPGLGDGAYFLIDKSRVQLFTLHGEKELRISLAKITFAPGEMPPEPKAREIALSLAKAAGAKLE